MKNYDQLAFKKYIKNIQYENGFFPAKKCSFNLFSCK